MCIHASHERSELTVVGGVAANEATAVRRGHGWRSQPHIISLELFLL